MVGHSEALPSITACQRSISSILSLCELSVWTLYQHPRHLFWIPWWRSINQSIHHACLVRIWRSSPYAPSHNSSFSDVLPSPYCLHSFSGTSGESFKASTDSTITYFITYDRCRILIAVNHGSTSDSVTRSPFSFLILPPPYSEPCTAQTVGDTGVKDRKR